MLPLSDQICLIYIDNPDPVYSNIKHHSLIVSANMTHWNNAVLMLGQSRRRWPNINPAMCRVCWIVSILNSTYIILNGNYGILIGNYSILTLVFYCMLFIPECGVEAVAIVYIYHILILFFSQLLAGCWGRHHLGLRRASHINHHRKWSKHFFP